MYILNRRIHASNDVLIKMWAVAAAVILCIAAALAWNDRFRESVETGVARVSVFGIEADGREAANFTGSRGFFAKMNKMGLPPRTRRAELSAMFDALAETGALPPREAAIGVPVLWVYAEGLTKEIRDRGVQTYGKFFFDKSRLCLSVADGNGFAVQLDPDTFRVLWARDGGAVCAIPLLLLPDDFDAAGFVFRIEERGESGAWKICGEVKIPAFPARARVPASDEDVSDSREREDASAPAGEDVPAEPDPREIEPASVEVESLTVPVLCRFYSEPLRDRAAFGELRVRIRGNASGKVPAAAWSLENFGLSAPTTSGGAGRRQAFPMSRADAFHKNVRFLDGENFESGDGGLLCVPAAKTLFSAPAENGGNAPWRAEMRLVRKVFFSEDFHAFPPMRVGKNASVLAEPISAKGETVKARAFRDGDYFRALNGRPAAVVLEIAHAPDGAFRFFWQPHRVKTEAGEELFPESVVDVAPGVRRYCFLPKRGDPAKIEVVFAVTRCVLAAADVVPVVGDVPAERSPED